MHQTQHLTDDDSSILPSSVRRLVKLPLRKHHSFHFQPSQTVAGALKQTKTRYKNNGPLVFKPFNEKSAFIPITPVPKSPQKSTDTEMTNGDHTSDTIANDGNEHVYNISSSTAAPRICGTSLKRHISNVETYNRARSIDETNSMSDDEDSASLTPPSSSSASTARGKRLHYADLAPLTSTSNTNLNLINSTTSSSRNNINNINNNNNNSNNNNTNNNNNNGCSNGIAGNIKNATDCKPNELTKIEGSPASSSAPIKRTTQYATLKFNEVKI